MELSRNLLCRKLGVEKGVLDFVNGLLFYQFFGGLSTDSPDDGGGSESHIINNDDLTIILNGCPHNATFLREGEIYQLPEPLSPQIT